MINLSNVWTDFSIIASLGTEGGSHLQSRRFMVGSMSRLTHFFVGIHFMEI